MDQVMTLSRSRPDSPEFREALMKHLGEAGIKSGEAFDSNGPDFIWAVASATPPAMILDDQPAGPMRRIAGSDLWFYVAQLRVGTSHRFHYVVDGKRFGGSYDVPAYTPLSYARPGVPQGRISEKLVHTSKLYGGMEIQLLDLRARPVRSRRSSGVDGLAGRGAVHHAERRGIVPPVPEPVPAA